MKHCGSCFYFKNRSLVTEWCDPVTTCLHPMSRTPTGFAMSCGQAREASAFCGPQGHCWTPASGAHKAVLVH